MLHCFLILLFCKHEDDDASETADHATELDASDSVSVDLVAHDGCPEGTCILDDAAYGKWQYFGGEHEQGEADDAYNAACK